MRVCKCGKQIEQPKRGPRRSECRECQSATGMYYWSEKSQRWCLRRKPRVMNSTKCQACGESFLRYGESQKRCDKCIRSGRLSSQDCVRCGCSFAARHGSGGYCSPYCAAASVVSEATWFVCGCGEVFSNHVRNKAASGRCYSCRAIQRRQNDLIGNARRRTRQHSAPYEVVNRLEVFERDGWRCKLCGDPVDRGAKPRSPMSATLDHVVPVALGGPHTAANVQCAHFRCNVRKGARPKVLAQAGGGGKSLDR